MISATATNWEEVLLDAETRDEPLVLYGVSWDDYDRLMGLTAEQKYPRLTYLNGVLIIMGYAGFIHENISRFLFTLISTTSLVTRTKVIPAGMMSLQSKRRRKGAQPDESFYIQNADRFPNKTTLWDDRHDAPPDLLIEVDETSKSTEKFAIYADFGVKEFWRCDRNRLSIYILDDFGSYVEVEQSVALPVLTAELLNEFLTRRADGDQFDALLDFETRLRETMQPKAELSE